MIYKKLLANDDNQVSYEEINFRQIKIILYTHMYEILDTIIEVLDIKEMYTKFKGGYAI